MRKRWSKDWVLEAIRQRHRLGLSMTTVWKTDRSLYGGAKTHFGSWHNALAAAGLPSRPQRKRTKEQVIAAIQERREKGLSLTSVWREDPSLYQAAQLRFGKWTNRPGSRWIQPSNSADLDERANHRSDPGSS